MPFSSDKSILYDIDFVLHPDSLTRNEHDCRTIRSVEASVMRLSSRFRSTNGPSLGAVPSENVTIRPAYPDDAPALARLAALDSAPLPDASMLVAEVDGELWAAVAIDGSVAIADPFRRSAGVVRLLEVRAAQLAMASLHAAERAATSR